MSSHWAHRTILRLFRFRLRTLLVVITLLGVFLGLQVKRARDQSRAVQAILQLGGSIVYDYEAKALKSGDDHVEPPGPEWLRKLIGEEYFREVAWVHLAAHSVQDGGLRHLQYFRRLKSLNLMNAHFNASELAHVAHLYDLEELDISGTTVIDADLVHIRNLDNLHLLNLSDTRCTDAGLRYIKNLRRLDSLYLENVAITDRGLESVRVLTGLKTLQLGGTQVTDDGFIRLAALRNLEQFYLERTSVGDRGVGWLGKLSGLRTLDLDDTEVSAQGFLALQQSCANCQINFDWVDMSDTMLGDRPWGAYCQFVDVLDFEGHLKFVDLSGTSISDAHLIKLESLGSNVQMIDVQDTRITDTGYHRLQRALPECEILR